MDPFTIMYFFSALLSLVIVFLVIGKKEIEGKKSFIWMILMAAEWALAAGFEKHATNIETKILWSKIEYLGNMSVSIFFLNFIIYFTQQKITWSFKKEFLIWIIPIFAFILAITNDFHHLVWSDFTWSPVGNNILVYHHGIAFWVVTPYCMIIGLLGISILIRNIINYPSLYKNQAFSLICACLFPILTTGAYISGLNPVIGLDISPFGIMFSGFFLFYAISQQRLFDLIPVAHCTLFKKMKDGMLVIDERQRILDYNPMILEMFNVHETISGKYYPEVFPALLDFWQNYTGKEEKNAELFIEDNNIWLEIICTPLKDEKDQFHGNLLILRNITIRKISENKLKTLNAQLKESEQKLIYINEQKDKFFSIIAHDLKSPFTTIIGLTEILSEDFDYYSEEEKKDYLISIKNAGNNTYKLLENLLEWAQSQTGAIPFNPQKLEIKDVVNEIRDVLKMNAQKKQIELLVNISSDIFVFADKNMLHTILRNLITNAIKFSYSGSSIEINCINTTKDTIISVKDQGVGIKEEDISKMFQIGYKLKNFGTMNEKGTGLGLLLCKEFVEKHGGKIWVESTIGEGSEFSCSFPNN